MTGQTPFPDGPSRHGLPADGGPRRRGQSPDAPHAESTGHDPADDRFERAARAEEAMRQRARRGLRLFGNLWLALMLLSGAAASLLFILLVAPMTVEGFRKAELDPPALVAWAADHRGFLAAGAGAVALLGLVAVFALRHAGWRLIVWGLCTLTLFGVAVLSIFGWWLGYIAQMRGMTQIG